MALHESYGELLNRAHALKENNQEAEAFDIIRRIVARVSRLSPQTLTKRIDLRNVLVGGAIDGSEIGRELGQTDAVIELAGALAHAIPESAAVAESIKAQALADAGRLDEAIAALRAASEMEGATAQALVILAGEALWHERAEDALAILERVPEQALPEQDQAARHELAAAWYVHFRALAQLERIEEAEQAWMKAYDLSRPEPTPTAGIVTMFVQHDDLNKALDYADREGRPATRGLLRGVVAALKGKPEWAKDEWQRIVREPFNVEKPDFHDWIECALRLGDKDKADAALDAAAGKYGYTSRMLLLGGVLEALNGDLDQARLSLHTLAVVNYRAKLHRERHIFERDRWLLEQTIPDTQVRSELIELLFNPTPEDALPSADEVEMKPAGEGETLEVAPAIDEAAAAVTPATASPAPEA